MPIISMHVCISLSKIGEVIRKDINNRETIGGIRISRLPKIPPLYDDWLRSLKG